jgi:putative acetyltransferase
MVLLVRTTSEDGAFRSLVALLDQDLAGRNGDKDAFYAQYNKVDTIRHAVVAYLNDEAVGCGAIKEFSPGVAEVKRMYVKPEARGNGVARAVLAELEKWAGELGFKECILETGIMNPEAIQLYRSSAYEPMSNYGQYAGVETSVCMKKAL